MDHPQQGDFPLQGLKVVEFTHMVMGPSTGVILGDLGADVVKVEPIEGDQTRRLLGSGAGYFPMFNRSKRSIRLNLKSPDGMEVARRLVAEADVLIENFRPGTLARLGLSPEACAELNPRLVYCSAKGFLSGPYEHRTALDEVTQMMGGLAYMTGPSGRPLRAGTSVIDITGGMFGVIGILAAIERRHRTGRGGEVKCSLFETTAYLVGQHIAQLEVTGKEAAPMPERISAWAISDVFETANEGEQLFLGVVSDGQWKSFTQAFGLTELGDNPDYAENNARVRARDSILPQVRALMRAHRRDEMVPKLEAIGLPFAPITRPAELLTDPHMLAGGLLDVTLEDGRPARLPALPIEMDGHRLPLARDIPQPGADTGELLAELGYDAAAIARLAEQGAVGPL